MPDEWTVLKPRKDFLSIYGTLEWITAWTEFNDCPLEWVTDCVTNVYCSDKLCTICFM